MSQPKPLGSQDQLVLQNTALADILSDLCIVIQGRRTPDEHGEALLELLTKTGHISNLLSIQMDRKL